MLLNKLSVPFCTRETGLAKTVFTLISTNLCRLSLSLSLSLCWIFSKTVTKTLIIQVSHYLTPHQIVSRFVCFFGLQINYRFEFVAEPKSLWIEFCVFAWNGKAWLVICLLSKQTFRLGLFRILKAKSKRMSIRWLKPKLVKF